jgi:uncharacterized protein YkwD
MLRSWRRGLIVSVLVLPACQTPRLAVAGPEGCGELPGDRVVAAINAARSKDGRSALESDPRLAVAAERHSADMARSGRMSHTGGDGSTADRRVRDAGYDQGGVGEVVAAGHRTPEAAVAGWLRSRRHRDILLLPDVVAVGAACALGSGGSLFWTAVVGERWVVTEGTEEP